MSSSTTSSSTTPSSLRIVPDHGRAYPVRFEPLASVPALLTDAGLRKGRCLVVTDRNVADLYAGPLDDALAATGWEPRWIVMPAGEATKAPEHLQTIYDRALSWSIDRQTPLLALGGGVVGDLGGFAAATLLRGLPFVQLPTTLIAQVDSALGGKTGINHAAGKNLIGAFYQPCFVCSDLSTLRTLPMLEWTSGLAEVVKHALIADVGFMQTLRSDSSAIIAREPAVVADVVRRAAAIKADVVSQDVHEHGVRALLNFGHTFGHAIERAAGYGRFTHGEAVALGMRAALALSERLHPDVAFDEARELTRRIPVRETLAGIARSTLIDAMYSDKKVQAGTLNFVVLRRPGEAYVTDDVTASQLQAAWDAIL